MSNNEINPNIIKEINNFVKKLTRNLDVDDLEITEFEEEMTSNIICSYTDLIDEGYSEHEALSIAFSRFGHSDYLKNDLRKLYNFKSIFSKNLLRITITAGTICTLVFAIFFVWNSIAIPGIANNTFETVKTELEKFENIENTDLQDKLQDIVENNIAIFSLGVNKIENYTPSGHSDSSLVYRYPAAESEDYWWDDVGYESFFIFKDVFYSNKSDFDLSELDLNVTLSLRRLDYNFFAIGEILLAIYWTMFAIWGALEVYFSDDNKSWIILFVLTNVIGYLIYRLVKPTRVNS